MSVFVDRDRLLLGLARTLRQRVMPALVDPSARFAAQTASEMILHIKHRRDRRAHQPDLAATRAMADEIRALTGGAIDSDKADRLIALLHADSARHGEDDAAFRDLLDAEGDLATEVFDPPTDDEVTRILVDWTGDPGVTGRVVGRAVGGYSKQTVFIDMLRDGALVRQLVMRRDLPFAEADRSSVVVEYPVLQALWERGYVVAEPVLLESDPAVLKSPFLLSARAAGSLAGDALGLHGTVDFDSEELLGKLLAELHRIDIYSLDLPQFTSSEPDMQTFAKRVDLWTENYRRDAEFPAAALEIGLAWLRANVHLVAGRRSIVHGDVGYHNILIDQGSVTALVDWELVHAGNPAEDLAYVSSYIERPEALIDHYVAHGGARPSEGAMAWCRMFGDIRNAVIGTVQMKQYNRGDHDDVSMLPIILSSYASYIGRIDRELAALITVHGFVWAQDE